MPSLTNVYRLYSLISGNLEQCLSESISSPASCRVYKSLLKNTSWFIDRVLSSLLMVLLTVYAEQPKSRKFHFSCLCWCVSLEDFQSHRLMTGTLPSYANLHFVPKAREAYKWLFFQCLSHSEGCSIYLWGWKHLSPITWAVHHPEHFMITQPTIQSHEKKPS